MPIPRDVLERLKAQDQQLTALDFSRYYHLTTADIRDLTDALRGNPHVVELVLCDSEIDDEGACFLAAGLSTMPSLVELDVSANHIGNAGAAALFRVPTLKFLNIAANSVTDEAAQQLLENTTLHYVRLNGNPVDTALVAKIDAQLDSNEQRELAQLRNELNGFVADLSLEELKLALAAVKESVQTQANKAVSAM